MGSILSFALSALSQVPSLVAQGVSIAAHVREAQAAVAQMVAENRGPSAEEWDQLHARIAGLLQELDA